MTDTLIHPLTTDKQTNRNTQAGMKKLLIIICCLLSQLLSVLSQKDCTYSFFTATCNPEVPLTVIPSDIPSDVRRIILSGNEIIAIDPGNLSYYPLLDYLDLSENLISYLPADLEDGMLILNELLLDNNPITSIEDRALEQMTTLFTLSLQGTELTTIEKDAFLGPTMLNELLFRNSKLESLSVDTFEHVQFLKILNLRSNSLQSLPEGIFTGLSFNDLSLSGNPWSCDCRMKWFRTYLQDNEASIEDIGSVTCHWPYSGTLMTDLTVDDFNCSAPSVKTHPVNDSIVTNISYTLHLEVDGSPFPNVTWYKDDEQITYDSNIHLNLYDASLHFVNTLINDSGVYYAEIENEYGVVYSDEAVLLVTEVTCFNGVKDEHETDTDCGGQYCTPCNQTQSCLVDSDCVDDLICLYSYQLPSELYYISPNNSRAFSCDNAVVARELLDTRLQNGLQSAQLFGSNFTVENDIVGVQNSMKTLLSVMLMVNEAYISDVQVTTIERSSSKSEPLLQIWFTLVKNSDGRAAHKRLLSLIDNGEVSGTIRISEERSRYNIRLNL